MQYDFNDDKKDLDGKKRKFEAIKELIKMIDDKSYVINIIIPQFEKILDTVKKYIFRIKRDNSPN